MVIVDPPLEELARRAAEIAKQGFPCFPCGLDKAPVTPHGHKDATDNPRLAYDLFMRYPDARMVGVPMGTEAAMVIAIDVDPLGMTWLRANWHRLGNPRIHRTPRGGVHLFYKMPKTGPIIDCRQVCEGKRLLSIGVDVKGSGGYVVFAGPKYEIVSDVAPCDLPIWMKNRLIRKPKLGKEVRQVQIHPGARALEGALSRVEYSKLGERNNLLYWAACRAGELVKQGVLGEQEATRLCVASGCRAGLSELEARRTVKSGVTMGRTHGPVHR